MFHKSFLVAAAIGSFSVSLLLADELTYFRSDRGIAKDAARLPENLGAPEALRWRTPLEPGHSSPILVGDKLFLTTYRDSEHELATVALDARTGKLLWKQIAPVQRLEQYHKGNGNPAAATPASDGQRLYVFFGSYGLTCYDLNGRKVWERPMGPFQDEFGASSSPVLVGDKVVLSEDHDVDSFLIALDRSTGEVAWKTPRPDAVRSYSTPSVWNHQGKEELLVAGALELAGYDPVSGEKLWWTHGLARIVIPVPVPAGDMIYMASWTPGGDPGKRLSLDPWSTALSKWDRNHDGKLSRAEIDNAEVLDRFYRMDLNQSGDLDQKEWERHAEVFSQAQNAALGLRPPARRGDVTKEALVWTHQRGAPYVATPLVHNGIFWMVKDGGIVTKLEAESGRLLQEERLPGMGGYYASPVAGEGKVYFAGELGTVSALAESRDWRVLSSHDFHEKIYATPVVAGDRFYLRTESAVYCFGGAR